MALIEKKMQDHKEILLRLKAMHSELFQWSLYCCSYQEQIAEDVLQISYEKLLKNKEKLKEINALKTYLFTIIKNSAIDYFRKQTRTEGRERSLEDESQLYRTATQEISAQKANDRQRIQEFLATLSNREAEILHLITYQDLTLKEAANVLDLTEGSVSTYYKRAKAKFKDEIISSHYRKKGIEPDFEKSMTLGFELFKVKVQK